MNTSLRHALCSLMCLIMINAYSQDVDPAYKPVVDVPGLPRVLLIGDSISIGYTVATQELLEGEANVHRIPVNGGPTTRGLEHIDEWLGESKWDVIHFNWGLHDLKFMEDGERQVSLVDYASNLETLTTRLKKTGAKLIWATTTPVPEGNVSPKRIPDDVEKYNATALLVMRKHRIQANNLYAFALPQLSEIQRPLNVHFTPEGSKVLAERVAAQIRRALSY